MLRVSSYETWFLELRSRPRNSRSVIAETFSWQRLMPKLGALGLFPMSLMELSSVATIFCSTLIIVLLKGDSCATSSAHETFGSKLLLKDQQIMQLSGPM